MKKLIGTICLALLSVACNDPAINKVAKNHIQMKRGEALGIEAEYGEAADSFSMFLLPSTEYLLRTGQISREDENFSVWTEKMKLIRGLGRENDKIDEDYWSLNKQQVEIDEQIEGDAEEVCMLEETDECIQYNEIGTKKNELVIRKSDVVTMIMNHLDVDQTKKENWYDYGTAQHYIINTKDPSKIKVVFPTLGNNKNYYSTMTGEIYDVELVPGKYASHIFRLKFKMKEKGDDGKFNGAVLTFDLEKRFFIGKLRYFGDVIRTKAGEEERRGTCKIDIPPASTI